MTYRPFQLGSQKHVFVDWDLIEPGYGLSFAATGPIAGRCLTGFA